DIASVAASCDDEGPPDCINKDRPTDHVASPTFDDPIVGRDHGLASKSSEIDLVIDDEEHGHGTKALPEGSPAALPSEEETHVFAVYFHSGGIWPANLSHRRMRELMRAIASSTSEGHSVRIKLVGRTDDVGTAEQNYELGLVRAKRVFQLL